MTENEYTQEERLLAALAHGSLLAGGIGIAAGILIYVTQKEKSAYAAGQALQAALYQAIGMAIIVISWTIWTFFYLLTLIPLIRNSEQYEQEPPAIFWIGLGSMIIPFLIMGVWGVYGLIGALRTWRGADFRYAVVGRLAENLQK